MTKSLFKITLAILCVLVFSTSLFGQGRPGMNRNSNWVIQVSGTVRDSSTKLPLQFATVKLFRSKDNKYITGSITNEKGKFFMDSVKQGKYYATVDFMGYNSNTLRGIMVSSKEGLLVKQLGNIFISSKATTMKRSVVTKKRAVLVNEIDKKVFNADANITSNGGTAQDLIENVPSVEVDQDGNISLRGNSNVIILIDGRPSGLTGAGRQAFLESIPASSIDRIEIITNPSAKYDPDGMSGIINIILKKNKLKGTSGMVSTSIGTNDNYNFATQLGYRNSKYNVFANYSLNTRRRISSSQYDKITYAFDEYLHHESESGGQNLSHLVKIGGDYYINKFHTLYFSANTGFGGGDRNSTSIFSYSDENGLPTSAIRRQNNGDNSKISYDGNLGYIKKYNKKNHELNIDFHFTNSERENANLYENGTLDSTSENYSLNRFLQDVDNNSASTRYSLKLDYTKPLKKKDKVDFGSKIDLRQIDNFLYSETSDSLMKFAPDVHLNNDFRYFENIFAVYGIYGKQYKKIGIQGGVRLEQANTKSELLGTNIEPIKNDYFSIFPSAHIKYSMTKRKEIMVSYSRRVNRPRTRQLNPFPRSVDPEKIFTGNAYLKPEYINSYELGYSYFTKKFSLTASTYVKQLTNMISRFKATDSAGVSIVTYDNFDKSTSIGFEIISNITPIKWWKIMLSGNANANKFTPNSEQADFDNSSFKWNVRAINTWTYNKVHSLQMTAFYRAPFDIPQGELKEMYGVDLGYKLKLWKGRASLGLRATDIFNTREFGYVTNDQFVFDEGSHKWQSQNFFINFSYNFGTQQKKRRQRSSGGDGGGGDMGM